MHTSVRSSRSNPVRETSSQIRAGLVNAFAGSGLFVVMSGGLSLLLVLSTGLNAPAHAAESGSRAAIVENYESSLWGLTAVGAQKIWGITQGNGVVVAVIDTGVDASHPDLQGRVVEGWSTVTKKDLPAGANNDPGGHGTHVAGIIAGALNGSGIVGVAPRATILPVQVLGAGGGGSDRSVAEGIDWAVANGAQVINLSLGGESNPFQTDASRSCSAVGRAFDADVVVIVSAGNDGSSGNPRSEPASCRGAFSVAAVDERLNRSYFSSFDATVSISAPGSAIISSIPTDERYPFAQWDGTSMAAPHVAGAAALLRAAQPSWTAQQVLDTLRASATDLGPQGEDPEFGAGLLDIAAAFGLRNVDKPTKAASLLKDIVGTSVPTIIGARSNRDVVDVRWNAPRGVVENNEAGKSDAISGYRVEVFGDSNGSSPTNANALGISVEVGAVTSVSVPFSGIPAAVRVTAIRTVGSNQVERVGVPFFDIEHVIASPSGRSTTKVITAGGAWVKEGLLVSYTTSGPAAPVSISVNAGVGAVFLTRSITSEQLTYLFEFPADSSARSLSATVGVSTELGTKYVTVAPQYLIKVAGGTAGRDLVSVVGSTAEACRSKAKVGCSGSAVNLVDAKTRKVIATTWVLANMRFGFDLPRKNVPSLVYVNVGKVRSMTTVIPNFVAKGASR